MSSGKPGESMVDWIDEEDMIDRLMIDEKLGDQESRWLMKKI